MDLQKRGATSFGLAGSSSGVRVVVQHVANHSLTAGIAQERGYLSKVVLCWLAVGCGYALRNPDAHASTARYRSGRQALYPMQGS